jgi:hypothetical protein
LRLAGRKDFERSSLEGMPTSAPVVGSPIEAEPAPVFGFLEEIGETTNHVDLDMMPH